MLQSPPNNLRVISSSSNSMSQKAPNEVDVGMFSDN